MFRKLQITDALPVIEDHMQSIQELAHAEDFDYVEGSPHLKHQRLHRRLASEIRCAMRDIDMRGLPPRLLDVGAGEGSFIESVLAAGWQVTASEMSRPSLDRLQAKYGGNPNFESIFDDGSFAALTGRKYSVVLFGSVLHHIPDYISTIQYVTANHLNSGGSLVTFQDPIWYARQGRGTRLLSEIAYASWRIRRGNVTQGMRNRMRRRRGHFDANNAADMVEYHVVRNGLDELALLGVARSAFEDASLSTYWSTQSPAWQGIGERLRLSNTFALVACNYLPQNPKKA